MVGRVEDLLRQTNLPVYQYSNRRKNTESFLLFDDVNQIPLYMYVPTLETHVDVLINLHELGHFIDWPRLNSPKLQVAFKTDINDLTEIQWFSLVAAEIRAWRNAVILASTYKELDICPRAWNHFLLRSEGLPSYYRHWERWHERPPEKLLGSLEYLYTAVEKLCPGF